MKITSNEIIFIVLVLVSIFVMGLLISSPIGLLLEGKYNTNTLLQMGIFIPVAIVAHIHLYNVYKKTNQITKNMFYTVAGYIVFFPIAFAVVVMFAAVLL